MRVYDLICKKRNGKTLTQEEINFFVRGLTEGKVPDYQTAALLMAACIKGMNGRETAWLTDAMCESGEKLNLASVPGIKVDKHSTGGVGDGISLVLAPLAAACGVPVPMVSGRGLGHTGGTLDKLESIPGFNVRLSKENFIAQVREIGLAMIGQTPEIAPADRKMYALRDVTATVDSIPLITASILSKKLAEGCDALVLDVKTGCGAFMREKGHAVRLARAMTDIGKRCRKKMAALVTNMNQPLGKAVGNSLEIYQAVEILSGKEQSHTNDFIELTEILGGWMLFLGGKSQNSKSGKEIIRQARKSGKGLEKFREMVIKQGGDPKVCESPESVLPRPKYVKEILSPWKGTVSLLDARSVGVAALYLGAGRENQESRIDPSAGIILRKKLGDSVERGESIAQFLYSDGAQADEAEKTFFAGVKIGKIRPHSLPLVYEVIY